MDKSKTDKNRPVTRSIRFGLLALRVYLLCGGVFVFLHNTWPIFMPPQFDLLGLFFNLIGSKLGVYLNVLLLSLPGLLFVLLAVLPTKQK